MSAAGYQVGTELNYTLHMSVEGHCVDTQLKYTLNITEVSFFTIV